MTNHPLWKRFLETLDAKKWRLALLLGQIIKEQAMNDRLNFLINSVDTSRRAQAIAPGVTSQQVRKIIEYGHIHFTQAYPGTPTKNKVAIVVMPDSAVHTVQITVDKSGSNKNHLCCITCLDPKNRVHCAAAVAALVVEMAERPAPKKAMDCPGCGEEL